MTLSAEDQPIDGTRVRMQTVVNLAAPIEIRTWQVVTWRVRFSVVAVRSKRGAVTSAQVTLLPGVYVPKPLVLSVAEAEEKGVDVSWFKTAVPLAKAAVEVL